MIGEQKLICLFIILTWTGVIAGFDPLSVVGIGFGAGSVLSAGWRTLVCRFTDCCSKIPHDLTSKASSSYMKRYIYIYIYIDDTEIKNVVNKIYCNLNV
jgi:hypothetical protein